MRKVTKTGILSDSLLLSEICEQWVVTDTLLKSKVGNRIQMPHQMPLIQGQA